jgi:GT2 family glycosyltransferase/glycosyltransferase involved in cell wall biosynthesis
MRLAGLRRTADDADMPATHRRRLIAPLLAGRTIAEWDCPGGAEPGRDLALHLIPLRGEAAVAQAEAMLATLAPGGIAVVVSLDVVAPSVLRRLAPHNAHYIQRAIAGSLVRHGEFDQARIAVLRDGPIPRDIAHLYLFAHMPLPPLETGVLERAACPARPALAEAQPGARPPHRPRGDEGRAAGLAHRLLAQEERLVRLQTQSARAEPAQGRPAQPWFDPPAHRFPWRLAEQPSLPDPADPYERRVDDPVIRAAQRGEAFFDRFGLRQETPDIAGALALLASMPNALAHAGDAPDISIVIPVYGQIAYTLNCLHSLFTHHSRFSAEVIVVDDASPDGSGALLAQLPQLRMLRQETNGGFITSCNIGAQAARGTWLVMLNNDTRVVDGWLDALIGSFARFPKAGLVGSKMLYPDGSLQEAGGIIWRDGGAWNYGRNDDPNRPHYSYARQVDYISGCSIAIRRDTWTTLGGFDPRYAPAYCEDADLCLRVADSGQQVWFQPQSRVVHYEGKTSGTDLSTNVKSYQVLNTKKLFLRWRGRLAAHRPNGQAPYAEKSRGIKMRMLVIDATTPTPDQDAGSLQTVLGLQACRALGYGTVFMPQDNFLFQPGYTTDLQAEGIECTYAPYDLDAEAYLRIYGHLFDVILVYRVTVLERTLAKIREHAPQAALLFHVADLHFLRMERQAALDGDAALAREADALRVRELAAVRAADCTITHSRVEAAMLAELVPGAPVATWPLMSKTYGTTKGFAERRDVLFLGGYRHPPNVDAVRYFTAEILPKLRRAEKRLRLIAAGANPTAEVAALAGAEVEVTGQIPDLQDVMDRARVFVCPLRVGAGVKGKIMTALAYGIPVVTTSVGIEGSGLEPGVHVLLADDAKSFARQTLRLYRDPELWQRLSDAGQVVMQGEYSPERGAGFLSAAIEAAWAHKLGVQAACASP